MTNAPFTKKQKSRMKKLHPENNMKNKLSYPNFNPKIGTPGRGRTGTIAMITGF